MKLGSEDRKKLILAGTLGVVALSTLIYEFAGSGSDTTPAPATPAVAVRRATPNPVAAHVSQSALDPTLHPEGMLATEALTYTGAGRNIFLAGSEPLTRVSIPKPIAGSADPRCNARAGVQRPARATADRPALFWYRAARGRKAAGIFPKGRRRVPGVRRVTLWGRRYRVGTINANSAQVTDLTNSNTQMLPLVQQ